MPRATRADALRHLTIVPRPCHHTFVVDETGREPSTRWQCRTCGAPRDMAPSLSWLTRLLWSIAILLVWLATGIISLL